MEREIRFGSGAILEALEVRRANYPNISEVVASGAQEAGDAFVEGGMEAESGS